jgi:hypothetical protein
MRQNEEKASFRGLKPVESTQFTSAPFEAQDELKHRPPEEKDFFRSLLGADTPGGDLIYIHAFASTEHIFI